MKRRDFFLGSLAAAVFGAGFCVPAFAEEAPQAFILRVSEDVLSAIRSDKRIKAGDKKAIAELVDQKVMPAVDFLRMTRMAVGPAWRTASDAQKEEMQKLFRQILINVYSGALTMVTDHKPTILPRSQVSGTDAVIKSALVPSSGEAVNVDYRLKDIKGKGWKVIDVNVEGVWLVSNYRSQFGPLAQSKGIAGLIAEMKKRVVETQNQGAKAK